MGRHAAPTLAVLRQIVNVLGPQPNAAAKAVHQQHGRGVPANITHRTSHTARTVMKRRPPACSDAGHPQSAPAAQNELIGDLLPRLRAWSRLIGERSRASIWFSKCSSSCGDVRRHANMGMVSYLRPRASLGGFAQPQSSRDAYHPRLALDKRRSVGEGAGGDVRCGHGACVTRGEASSAKNGWKNYGRAAKQQMHAKRCGTEFEPEAGTIKHVRICHFAVTLV